MLCRHHPLIDLRRQFAVSLLSSWCAIAAAQAPSPSPAPGGAALRPAAWLERGRELLEVEDPLGAWRAFRRAAQLDADSTERDLGLGRTHLLLGRGEYAAAYGESALAADPRRQDAMALIVRSLIRSRDFEAAVRRSRLFTARADRVTAPLLAARGSALFRVQRTDDAAMAYKLVIDRDPAHAEAHLRLGSGLLGPTEVVIPTELRLAVAALVAEERERAIELLQRVLQRQPDHPIAHRLLGESLFADRTARSMAMRDSAYRALAEALPQPVVQGLPIAEFVDGYRRLAAPRRRIVERTAALFRRYLPKLVAVGGRHDLLHELERTTDANARRSLRGRRTFDGRVWDDVRGVGGLHAATGIEALDEAATFGFDTFAHEVAHQVHFFAFSPLQRARIRALYRRAMAEQLCLDYYAASNEAEYFGQGVEAFVSLAKRPGGETTHGHTRFELKRLDPELHDFIAESVDFDPLADERVRDDLLALAVAVALRCGRPEDAVVAAQMMGAGERRDLLLEQAELAQLLERCH